MAFNYDERVTLSEIEKRAILAAIKRAGGNRLRAAEALGIGKTTVYRKLKEYERARQKVTKRRAGRRSR
jgi:DNA-binding NtrC family response regulator